MMNERGKSDPAVVAAKLANKAERSAAEPVEPRAGTKGNANQQHSGRTQSRETVSQVLARIRQTARERKKERFTALFHHINVELLRDAFFAIRREAAPGVDGVTWQDYAANVETNLHDLHARPTGSVSGTAVPASVHTQAGRPAAPARGRRPGRQDCPTGDGHTAQRDLRGGLPRLFVRIPARTQRAPRDGCARGWNREQEGELDTGRRYPIIL